jgi:putative transposase
VSHGPRATWRSTLLEAEICPTIGGHLSHRQAAAAPNNVWVLDFVFDRTTSGSPLKWLSIVDEYTRECLALKVSRKITSEDVIDTLAELLAMRGVPQHIRCENGPEFVADALRQWLSHVGVATLYIEPGSPRETGYAESFHGRFCDDFLAMEIFDGLREAQALTAVWRKDNNTQRPHSSLGYPTPVEIAAACAVVASAKASAPTPHAGSLGQPCS